MISLLNSGSTPLPALHVVRVMAPDAATVALLHAYEVPFERQLRLAGVSAETLDEYRSPSATTRGTTSMPYENRPACPLQRRVSWPCTGGQPRSFSRSRQIDVATPS